VRRLRVRLCLVLMGCDDMLAGGCALNGCVAALWHAGACGALAGVCAVHVLQVLIPTIFPTLLHHTEHVGQCHHFFLSFLPFAKNSFSKHVCTHACAQTNVRWDIQKLYKCTQKRCTQYKHTSLTMLMSQMLSPRFTLTISILIPFSFVASRLSLSLRTLWGGDFSGALDDAEEPSKSAGVWWWLRKQDANHASALCQEGVVGSRGKGGQWEDSRIMRRGGTRAENVSGVRGGERESSGDSDEESEVGLEEDMLVIELNKLMDLVLRDFVDEWYKVTISEQDEEFGLHVRAIVSCPYVCVYFRIYVMHVCVVHVYAYIHRHRHTLSLSHKHTLTHTHIYIHIYT